MCTAHGLFYILNNFENVPLQVSNVAEVVIFYSFITDFFPFILHEWLYMIYQLHENIILQEVK